LLLQDIEQHGRQADRPLRAAPATLGPQGAAEARELVSGRLISEKPL